MAGGAGGPQRLGRALLSVQDKRGLADLATGLHRLGVELWATGGTRRAIEAAEVPCRSVEELTAVDAWFDGRVKTLHPAVFGGILAPSGASGDAELARRHLFRFDLVAVNFYPFEAHLRDAPAATDREEYIDIGGVALARAAAKNHGRVVVVTDPAEYPGLLRELEESGGTVTPESRLRLAVAAFSRCSRYDAAIAGGLGVRSGATTALPSEVRFRREATALRYGENPHQAAASYAWDGPAPLDDRPVRLELRKGDALSYTNLLDLETAVGLVEEFEEPAAAVVKHATPCGVATGTTLRAALEAAIATDPVARYGCAVAVNRPIGADDPAALHGVFVDLILAPGYGAGALEALGRRPRLKVVEAPVEHPGARRWEARSALGRLLVQEADRRPLDVGSLRLVAGPAVPADALGPLGFGWSVVRHARSNAIVLAQGRATVGIGSGQPTRVKAVELACEVAGPRARGAVLASDAFFPFADGVEVAARAGVRAIVQPGGSVRDAEVNAAAERAGIAMYVTGWRVFRH